jgi:thiamine-monophosphate kinase
LGDAVMGFTLLEEGETPEGASPDAQWLLQRHLAPQPRVNVGRRIAQAGVVSAMIDVSDGLATDLKRLCTASGVGACIELEQLPRSSPLKSLAPTRGLDPLEVALTGGEDYELLFTTPEDKVQALAQQTSRSGPIVSRIGTVTAADEGVVVLERDGRVRPLVEEGFDHFRASQ